MHTRSISTVAVAAALLLIGLGSPSAAAADIGVTTRATQTYELRPADGVVHVTIDMSVKNTTPSITTYEPCTQWYWDPYWGYTPYSTTCPRKTSYYINESWVWVEDGARNVRMSADAGSVSKSVDSHTAGFTDYRVKFQRIFYGKTRKLHITYDLASSAPRSGGAVRAGLAYASFCVSGNGPDGGQIRVVMPDEFDVGHSESADVTFTSKAANGTVTYSTGELASPVGAWACFDGVNLGGYARQTVNGPDGRSVIVAGWPEDPAWSTAVAADVRSSLPSLEALVGRPLPGTGTLEVREGASSGLGDYAGYYAASTNVAIVGEDYLQGGLVAHELSHAWFNETNFDSTWLSEGFAGWVESQNGGASCARRPNYPGIGKPDLEDWTYLGPKSTEADRNVVTYQYDAACWLIADTATRIGSERMTAVIANLLDGASAYGSTSVKASTPATWRAWLDAVDELGMVPAGEADLDLVQAELADAGIATNATMLADRSAARAAYHALVQANLKWRAPEAVRAPLTSWSFPDANAAINAAQRAYASTASAAAAVPESNALTGPLKAQWEAATTLTELNQVADLAGQEADAAQALVAAEARADGVDLVSQTGLLGTDLAAMSSLAIDALRRADPAAAAAATASLVGVLDGASGAGWLRIGLTVGVGLALVFLAAFLMRRRRSRTGVLPASARPVEPTPVPAPPPVPEPTPAPLPVPVAATSSTQRAADRRGWLAGMVSDPETARAMLRRDVTGKPASPPRDAEPGTT